MAIVINCHRCNAFRNIWKTCSNCGDPPEGQELYEAQEQAQMNADLVAIAEEYRRATDYVLQHVEGFHGILDHLRHAKRKHMEYLGVPDEKEDDDLLHRAATARSPDPLERTDEGAGSGVHSAGDRQDSGEV